MVGKVSEELLAENVMAAIESKEVQPPSWTKLSPGHFCFIPPGRLTMVVSLGEAPDTALYFPLWLPGATAEVSDFWFRSQNAFFDAMQSKKPWSQLKPAWEAARQLPRS